MQIGSFKLSTPMALLMGGGTLCIVCCGISAVTGALQSPADKTATAIVRSSLPAATQPPGAAVSGGSGGSGAPRATATPDERPVLGAVEVFKAWDGMTAIQKPDYEKTIIGRRIADTGKVGEVYESGYVYLTVQGAGALQRVNLYDLPRNVLSGLAKDQNVKFEGTIRKFNNLLGQTIEVAGSQIVP